jgi:hypothetical protein
MADDRISKLPKWAQQYIQELEQRAIQAEEYADALRVMIDGAPDINPDVLPPASDTLAMPVLNGWIAARPCYSYEKAPRLEKACTSSLYHAIGQWDETRSQNPKALYSSPSLALRALLPKILKAYADEIDATLQKIKEYEQE